MAGKESDMLCQSRVSVMLEMQKKKKTSFGHRSLESHIDINVRHVLCQKWRVGAT